MWAAVVVANPAVPAALPYGAYHGLPTSFTYQTRTIHPAPAYGAHGLGYPAWGAYGYGLNGLGYNGYKHAAYGGIGPYGAAAWGGHGLPGYGVGYGPWAGAAGAYAPYAGYGYGLGAPGLYGAPHGKLIK